MITPAIASSSEILLLQQKVNLLETYFNWTIGGLTITIGVLMGIFALIQFVYQKKIQQEEITKIESLLKAKIEEELLLAREALVISTEMKIIEVENKLKSDIESLTAEISRRFAIDCSKDNIPATALDWWLSAAVGYANTGSEELCTTSIRNAKESLEKISNQFDLDCLLEYSGRIDENLGKLSSKRKVEAELLAEMFKAKIKSSPTVRDLPSIPV